MAIEFKRELGASRNIYDFMAAWDTLEQRCVTQLAVTMYKAVNNLFPARLYDIFEKLSQVHSHN